MNVETIFAATLKLDPAYSPSVARLLVPLLAPLNARLSDVVHFQHGLDLLADQLGEFVHSHHFTIRIRSRRNALTSKFA